MESEYRAQDRKVEQSQEGAEIISASYYWRERLFELYPPKFSIRNRENGILGAIYYAKRVNYQSNGYFFNGPLEYCHNVGLINSVPRKLLKEGVNFCW